MMTWLERSDGFEMRTSTWSWLLLQKRTSEDFILVPALKKHESSMARGRGSFKMRHGARCC
jgi:hypothetical protein